MKKEIMAIGICITLLLVIFSSGCMESGTTPSGEGGTEESQTNILRVVLSNYNDTETIRVEVYIDGVQKGLFFVQPHHLGDGDFFEISEGTHTIVANADGRPNQTQTVHVSAGSDTTITFKFY